jgi:hypothetical protein
MMAGVVHTLSFFERSFDPVMQYEGMFRGEVPPAAVLPALPLGGDDGRGRLCLGLEGRNHRILRGIGDCRYCRHLAHHHAGHLQVSKDVT